MYQASDVRPAATTHLAKPQWTGRVSRPRAAISRGETQARLGRRAITRIGLVTMLAACIACTGTPLSVAAGNDRRARNRAEGPGTVFDSIEAAALDALTNAHLTATPRDRQRLRVGTVYRVANGFSYAAPKRSAASSPLMGQSVRYRLRSIDVARYVIQARSGEGRLNRSNEMPSKREKRIVDELDPAHRPLYLLTPSLDVVRYSRGGQLRVVTNLNERIGVSRAFSGPESLIRSDCQVGPRR